MKQIITVITSSGQITLPSEVRRLLGVKERDRIAFVIDGRRVTVVPVKFTIESAAGSVGPPTSTEDIEKRLRDAKDEMAESVARSGTR